MTEAIASLMFVVEYAVDLLLCIGVVTFMVLINLDHGLN